VKVVRDATITEPDGINLANEWYDAYCTFSPCLWSSLEGDALAKAEKEWGRVDGRMIAYVYSFIDIVFVSCNMSSNELLGIYFLPDRPVHRRGWPGNRRGHCYLSYALQE